MPEPKWRHHDDGLWIGYALLGVAATLVLMIWVW